jgi:hypothetical protein
MKNNMQRAAAVFLVIAGLTALNQSKTFQLHANPQACSASILLGGYGAGTTGLINNSSDPNDFTIGTFVPFAEAVRFVFDGGGKVSGSSTADFGGSSFPVTFSGTYSVKPNCTGSLAVNAGGSIIHRDLVIVDGGKEVDFVSTDPGLVIAGYMKKQRTDGE